MDSSTSFVIVCLFIVGVSAYVLIMFRFPKPEPVVVPQEPSDEELKMKARITELEAELNKTRRNVTRLFDICEGIAITVARPNEPIKFSEIYRCPFVQGDQKTTTVEETYIETLGRSAGHVLIGLREGESSTSYSGRHTLIRQKS